MAHQKKKEGGIPILKIWQGKLEVAIRAVVAVRVQIIVAICVCWILSVATIVAGSLGLYHIRSEAPKYILIVLDQVVQENIQKSYDDIILESVSAAGLGLGGAIAVFNAEVLVLILRFLNFGIVNNRIKIFLTIDVIMSGLLGLTFFICGILAGISAQAWRKLLTIRDFRDRIDINVIIDIRDTLEALTATAILSAFAMLCLFILIIAFLSFNWNKKLQPQHTKSHKHHRRHGRTRTHAAPMD